MERANNRYNEYYFYCLELEKLGQRLNFQSASIQEFYHI